MTCHRFEVSREDYGKTIMFSITHIADIFNESMPPEIKSTPNKNPVKNLLASYKFPMSNKLVQLAVSTTVIASTLIAFSITAALPLNDNSTDIQHIEHSFELVSREEWGGKPPTKVTLLATPPFVIIHHTYLPAACYTAEKCKAAMKSMQRYHQEEKGWEDIGYNFVIGSEGRVYEGGGWGAVGTHAAGYNSRSLGVCLVGDWRAELPPKEQLATTKLLLEYGVLQGFIPQNYTLLGHRQVRATTCPGQALFDEIQTWPQYSSEPSRP